MTNEITLKAEIRTAVGSGVNALRRAGKVPAVVYGRHVQSFPVQVDAREVVSVLRKAGRNTLIALNVAGKDAPQMVLVRDVQRDPIRHTIQHIDFYAVSMTEKISATIRVSASASRMMCAAAWACCSRSATPWRSSACPPT
jgi:large subunit ribosomal protein L25